MKIFYILLFILPLSVHAQDTRDVYSTIMQTIQTPTAPTSQPNTLQVLLNSIQNTAALYQQETPTAVSKQTDNSCLILGDSLSVGVGMFKKECQQVAKVGISSRQFLQKNNFPSAKHILISLGSNDANHTLQNVQRLRAQYPDAQVTWILPMKKGNARTSIQQAAQAYDDRVIDPRTYSASPDGVHPTMTSYQKIANQWSQFF